MFAGGFDAGAQMSLDVLARDGYVAVPITRPEKNALLIRSIVNGRKASFIVDTGCNATGLALGSHFERFFPKPSQPAPGAVRGVTGRPVRIARNVADSVVLANAEFRNVPVDFGPYRMAAGADGLIGAGFLRMCSAIVDLHNLRLYLRPPGTGRRVRIGPALTGIGFAEAPFKIVNNECLVDIELNGMPGVIVADTGAFFGIIDPRFAAKADAHSYRTNARLLDVSGATSAIGLSRLRSFKIAGTTPVRATYVQITPFLGYSISGGKLVGLLGIDILGPNGTIIDFAQQKLYFFKAR